MSIFGKIMDILYEEVPAPSAPGAPAGGGGASRPSELLRQARAGGAPAPGPATAAHGGDPAPGFAARGNDESIYREFCDSLARAIESANLPGFDFFEFHQLFKRFLKEGKTEQESIRTALASAETMRINKNVLIANYRHYEKILGEQKSLFEQELKRFYEENIKGAHDTQQEIDRNIAAKEKQIETLQREIEELKQNKSNMGINAEKAARQTEEVQNAFSRAFKEITEELTSLVGKIQNEKE